MKYPNILLVLLALCCTCIVYDASAQESASRVTLIRPGHSVGLLQLGDARKRAYELFPSVGEFHQELSYNSPCSRKEVTYFELFSKEPSTSEPVRLAIYSAEERIFQIGVSTPKFRTTEGLGPGSLPDEVRQHYNQLRAIVKLKKDEKKKDQDRPVYWVDLQQGIAFEFRPDKQDDKKHRRVASVIIFQVGGPFEPDGCTPPGWELRELRPFTFE